MADDVDPRDPDSPGEEPRSRRRRRRRDPESTDRSRNDQAGGSDPPRPPRARGRRLRARVGDDDEVDLHVGDLDLDDEDDGPTAPPRSKGRRRTPGSVGRGRDDLPRRRRRLDQDDEDEDEGTRATAPWERDPEAPVPRVVPAAIRLDDIDPDAAKVVKRLVRSGHVAYLVGGSVRDLLLARRPKDFDVATSARPNEVRSLFRNCRIIGRRFRLAHILFGGGKIIETATFRRDPGADVFDDPEIASRLVAVTPNGKDGPVEDDAPETSTPSASLAPGPVERDDVLIRHDNVFGEPHEDAIRRDFTINGLFYDVHRNEVIDYVGGLADVEARVIRTIGSPALRLREDPVRILRAIKFSARLDLGIDPDLYDAMVVTRDDLGRSAPPRVLEEVLRLLRGGAAHRSVFLALETGVLSVVLPEVAALLDDLPLPAFWARLDVVDQRQRAGQLPTDAVLLATLLHDALDEELRDVRDQAAAFEDFMDGVVERFAVPRRLKERLRSVVIAQRRLAQGRIGSLPRRDFFPEAATLHAIDLEAQGKPVPEWARKPEAATPEPTGSGRRRHRRRRRR